MTVLGEQPRRRRRHIRIGEAFGEAATARALDGGGCGRNRGIVGLREHDSAWHDSAWHDSDRGRAPSLLLFLSQDLLRQHSADSRIVDTTNSQFNYDGVPRLPKHVSFGSHQVVARDPFRVRYGIQVSVESTDGTAVDELYPLLTWAANSGVLNTKGFDNTAYFDDTTGPVRQGSSPHGIVHFDVLRGNGRQLVNRTPVIGDGGRSITLDYERFFVDWELVFGVGLAAHVAATRHWRSTTPGSRRAPSSRRSRVMKPPSWRIADPLAAVEAFSGGEVDVVDPLSEISGGAHRCAAEPLPHRTAGGHREHAGPRGVLPLPGAARRPNGPAQDGCSGLMLSLLGSRVSGF
jgi:hypothetical protein